MRKIYLGIIMLMLAFTLFGNETINGKVLREKQDSHIGIKVELLDGMGKVISTTKTAYSGDFKLENPLGASGTIKITDFDGSAKTIWFDEKLKDKNIGTIVLNSEKAPGTYIFSNVLGIIIIIINFLIIYFIRKSPSRYDKKDITLAITFLNIYFIGEFLRFAVAWFNESIAAYLWPISHLGTAFSCIFLLQWAIKAPVDRTKTPLYFVPKVLLTISTVIVGMLFSWIILGSDNNFAAFYRFEAGSLILIEELISILSIALVSVLMILNILKNKNTIEAQVSRIIMIRMITSGIVLVTGIFYFWIFAVNEPFGGYYHAMLAIVGTIIYWAILKYCYNFRYMRTYRKFFKIFIEIFKYFILMVTFFLCINILKADKTQQGFIYIIGFIGAKGVLDLYFHFFLNRGLIQDEKLITLLEAVNTTEWFCHAIEEHLPKMINVENVKILINEINSKDKELYKSLDGYKEELIEKELKSYEITKDYDVGFKMVHNNEVNGLILIKNSGRILGKNEFEFMVEFAKKSSNALNNLILLQAKERLAIKSIKSDNLSEELMYIKGYAEIINRTTDNEEIKMLSKRIIDKVEKRGIKDGV